MDSTHMGLVRCETSDGMFSNEVAVSLNSNDGPVSFFADRGLIQEKNGATYLVVSLVQLNQAGRISVLLPSETFEKGTRWVEVSPSMMAAI